MGYKRSLKNPYIARVKLSGQEIAMSKVHSAIKKGILIHPSLCLCEDCGSVASQYDHRDYNFPLLVAPVCRKCNINRGQAIPKHGFFEQMINLGHTPYEYRIHMERLARLFGYTIDDIDSLPLRITKDHWIKSWPGLMDLAASQRMK